MNTSLNHLPSIESVSSFNPAVHGEFLNEVSDLFKKHHMLDRIGLCLLHQHYDIRPNEILVETTESQNRITTLQPVDAISADRANLLETAWKVEIGGRVTVFQYCARCGRDRSVK
jgi:hypothetical protein